MRRFFVSLAGFALAGNAPLSLPPDVADLIVRARAESAAGDRIWPGFASAPFGFLFVRDEGELLLCDGRLPDGFAAVGRDTRLDCDAAGGPSTWRKPALLAAMPVFGPPSVVVMGAPAASGRDAEGWIGTVLHEHFHQWQSSLPAYYDRVAALDLTGGDETGMWMLDYAFPYDNPEAGAAWREAALALSAAVAAEDWQVRQAAGSYLGKRRALAASVSEADWRYYDFQLWQEGVARWTEMALGEGSADPAIARSALGLRESSLMQLLQITLAEERRESAYSFGAAEAMLLERIDPDWRGCYRASLSLGACWDSLMLEAQND